MSASLKPAPLQHSQSTSPVISNYHLALGGVDDSPWLWMTAPEVGDTEIQSIGLPAVAAAITAATLNTNDCLAAIATAAQVVAADNVSGLEQLTLLVDACCEQKLSYLNEQLMLVELPITLLYHSDCRDNQSGEDTLGNRQDIHGRLVASTQDRVGLMCQRVSELLDDDGWPGPLAIQDFGILSASWTRSAALLQAMGWAIDDEATQLLRWLPRQIMRLLRKDRSLMLSKSPARVSGPLLDLMLKVFGDADDALIAKRTVDCPPSPRPNLVMIDKSRNSISIWGGSLLFHDRWERNACKLAAEFDAAGCRLEIAKTKSLISGHVFPQLIVDGNPVAPIDQPDVLVDYVDGRVAVAEIVWHLENEINMQRQIILSMEDKFAWIGDAVNAPRSVEIDYRCQWQLADAMCTVGESENTEGYLFDGKKMRALVISPAASEWKSGPSPAKLQLEKTDFTLTVKRRGRHLYAPVFIDLSPKRCLKPRTWRQLTVAQSLEIVDDDVAVAYRVAVGKKQFVFYRSMASPANRTFFGENVNTEMFFGRLEKTGVMTELVQIE